jgi:hypothetical protein
VTTQGEGERTLHVKGFVEMNEQGLRHIFCRFGRVDSLQVRPE